MTIPVETADNPEKLDAFESRLASGDRVEPGEWMPAKYRAECLRLIQMHANSELMGALPEREWIPRAPTLSRKMALVAKVQDEIGHAQLLYRVAEDLGKPRAQMIDELLAGTSKFHNVFHYPADTWADVAIIQVFVDGAAMQTQGSLRSSSYAPYARVLKRICYEEDFHIRLGIDNFKVLAEGTPAQRAMLQDALNRWWQPLMHFFGPRDQASPHLETMLRWRIKVKGNDELRQQFLRQFVPIILEYGVHVPDPGLKWDEASGQYACTEPDWDEFKRIIKGGGPRTRARLELRNRYHAQHRWVREAVARWELAA
ncbi:MAG: 1,2-phenylacetyl-CoA epoxidase subunit PaaA [Armatimonadota bacterium]